MSNEKEKLIKQIWIKNFYRAKKTKLKKTYQANKDYQKQYAF